MLKTLGTLGAMAVLIYGLSAPTSATTFDRRTYFTFSQPVAIPGVTLPAGTYEFRLVDPTTSGRVLNVSNYNGTESLALLLTIPAHRSEASADPEVSFMETAEGMPAAIESVWWGNGRDGFELMYSKDQMARLTQGIGGESSVSAAIDVDEAAATETGQAARPEAPAYVEGSAAGTKADAQAAQPAYRDDAAASGSEAAIVEDAVKSESEPSAIDDRDIALAPIAENQAGGAVGRQSGETGREELPRTAGLGAIVLLLGLGSLGGGLWLTRSSDNWT